MEEGLIESKPYFVERHANKLAMVGCLFLLVAIGFFGAELFGAARHMHLGPGSNFMIWLAIGGTCFGFCLVLPKMGHKCHEWEESETSLPMQVGDAPELAPDLMPQQTYAPGYGSIGQTAIVTINAVPEAKPLPNISRLNLNN